MYSGRNIEKVWGTVVMKKHPEKILWMFFSVLLRLVDAHIYLIFSSFIKNGSSKSVATDFIISS